MNTIQIMTIINKIIMLICVSTLFGYYCAEYVKIINVNNNFKSNTCYLSDLSYVQKYRYGSNENVNIVIGNIYYENEQIYNFKDPAFKIYVPAPKEGHYFMSSKDENANYI